jgi:hypothetical protein
VGYVLKPIFARNHNNMKIKLIAIGFLISCGNSWSQTQLSPQVFASQGNNFKNGQFEISYTIGELAAVSTLSVSSFTLTQGFHQTDKFTVAFVEDINSTWEASLFPNPVNDQLNLKIETSAFAELEAKIFDATGRIVAAYSNLKCLPGSIQFPISTNGFAAGAYLMRINSKKGKFQKTLRFNKLQS